MKCPRCGFVEIGDGYKCRNCDAPLQRSIILFPLSQAEDGTSAPETPQLDWRAQVRERTREFRARKKIAAAMREAAKNQQARAQEREISSKASNPIVEAALNRLRRNTSNGADEFSSTPSSQLAVGDKKRHSDVSSDPTGTRSESPSLKKSSNRTDLWASKSRVGAAPAYKKLTSTEDPPTAAASPSTMSPSATASASSADESSQRDGSGSTSKTNARLAERIDVGSDEAIDGGEFVRPPAVANVSKGYAAKPNPAGGRPSSEFRMQTATFRQRLRAGIVDVLVLLLVNIPFVALIELSHGNFADREIQLALVGIALTLHLFYVTLMLAAAGQTIGMMVVSVVAVDTRSLNLPSFRQALGRALGTLLAAAPAFLGFLFPTLDPKRRSISDLISGTTVMKAFEDIDEVQIPWLYHHIRS